MTRRPFFKICEVASITRSFPKLGSSPEAIIVITCLVGAGRETRQVGPMILRMFREKTVTLFRRHQALLREGRSVRAVISRRLRQCRHEIGRGSAAPRGKITLGTFGFRQDEAPKSRVLTL